jgi:hypothetical protein
LPNGPAAAGQPLFFSRHKSGGESVRIWPFSAIQPDSLKVKSFMGYHYIRFRTSKSSRPVTLYFPDHELKTRAANVINELISRRKT